MIKRIFILCILLLIAAYLVLSATVLNSEPNQRACKGMELSIKDSIDYGFITSDEVKSILKRNKIYGALHANRNQYFALQGQFTL